MHYEIHFILLFYFLFQPLDLLLMLDMRLLNHLVGGTNHIFMDLSMVEVVSM